MGGEAFIKVRSFQQRMGMRIFWLLLGTALLLSAVKISYKGSESIDQSTMVEIKKSQEIDNLGDIYLDLSMKRPPLKSLIQDFDSKVIGDVQFLMDFAIIGEAKCATSQHASWFRRHPEILMQKGEVRSLNSYVNKPAEMVSLLYSLPPGPFKRGYKSPSNLRNPKALKSFGMYWPETKLIVGLRHPISWMKSYYNFKLKENQLKLPPMQDMLRPGEFRNRAEFAGHLSLLGKTNVLDPGEARLLGPKYSSKQPPKLPNKVFLYEITQSFDSTNGRNLIYSQDMSKFLGLKQPLSPLTATPPEQMKEKYKKHKNPQIDICDSLYNDLRSELLEIGRNASEWIETYFLKSPDVTVSSPDHFRTLLRSWSVDPCTKKSPSN